jgi:hypothetical protein
VNIPSNKKKQNRARSHEFCECASQRYPDPSDTYRKLHGVTSLRAQCCGAGTAALSIYRVVPKGTNVGILSACHEPPFPGLDSELPLRCRIFISMHRSRVFPFGKLRHMRRFRMTCSVTLRSVCTKVCGSAALSNTKRHYLQRLISGRYRWTLSTIRIQAAQPACSVVRAAARKKRLL